MIIFRTVGRIAATHLLRMVTVVVRPVGAREGARLVRIMRGVESDPTSFSTTLEDAAQTVQALTGGAEPWDEIFLGSSKSGLATKLSREEPEGVINAPVPTKERRGVNTTTGQQQQRGRRVGEARKSPRRTDKSLTAKSSSNKSSTVGQPPAQSSTIADLQRYAYVQPAFAQTQSDATGMLKEPLVLTEVSDVWLNRTGDLTVVGGAPLAELTEIEGVSLGASSTSSSSFKRRSKRTHVESESYPLLDRLARAAAARVRYAPRLAREAEVARRAAARRARVALRPPPMPPQLAAHAADRGSLQIASAKKAERAAHAQRLRGDVDGEEEEREEWERHVGESGGDESDGAARVTDSADAVDSGVTEDEAGEEGAAVVARGAADGDAASALPASAWLKDALTPLVEAEHGSGLLGDVEGVAAAGRPQAR